MARLLGYIRHGREHSLLARLVNADPDAFICLQCREGIAVYQREVR